MSDYSPGTFLTLLLTLRILSGVQSKGKNVKQKQSKTKSKKKEKNIKEKENTASEKAGDDDDEVKHADKRRTKRKETMNENKMKERG